jgi:ribonuclease R
MLLRSMQQAVYSRTTSATSAWPMRRMPTSPARSAAIPDLLTHRAIKAILLGKKYEPKIASTSVLNTNVSNATRKQQAKDKAEGREKKPPT